MAYEPPPWEIEREEAGLDVAIPKWEYHVTVTTTFTVVNSHPDAVEKEWAEGDILANMDASEFLVSIVEGDQVE